MRVLLHDCAQDKNVDFVGKCSNSKKGKEKDGMPNAEGEEESNSYVSMCLSFSRENAAIKFHPVSLAMIRDG